MGEGKGLRVLKLVSENVKGLKAVDITPDEHFQVVSGKNGAGKTSVLDAMWLALGGADAAKGTDRPVRDGEEEGYTFLDLGEIIVTKKWKAGGGTPVLEVRTREGAKFTSPQKVLDELIGKISFDPAAFAMVEGTKQKKVLMDLVGVNVDEFDARKNVVFDKRSQINRDVERLKGALASKFPPIEGLPEEEESSSDIMSELEAALAQINSNNQHRVSIQNIQNQISREFSDIEAIDREITKAEQHLGLLRTQRQAKVDLADKLEQDEIQLTDDATKLPVPNVEEIRRRLNDVDGINQKVRAAKDYQATDIEYKSAKSESDKLTEQLKGIQQEREDALKSATFPIKGLGFSDDGVTFNGVPLKQCSAAERLKVSMTIAMALNPRLKVIRIVDGSLLDGDNMKIIQELAEKNDYQVWVEVVDSTGKVGLYIEDGEVGSVNAYPPQEPDILEEANKAMSKLKNGGK